MINKPRFRKGKKAFRRTNLTLHPDGRFHPSTTPKQVKLLHRYLAAIDRFHEARRQSVRVMMAAATAASAAMQIRAIQTRPIPRNAVNREELIRDKQISIAQACIDAANSIQKAFNFLPVLLLILFLVTSCVTAKHARHHSKANNQPKTQ